MARVKFEKVFNHRINQLLHVHPADKMDGDRPFWTLPRRLPHPLTFDGQDEAHCAYLVAMAMLYARMFGIDAVAPTHQQVLEAAAAAVVPAFSVKGADRHEFDESLTEEQRKQKQEEAVSADEITRWHAP